MKQKNLPLWGKAGKKRKSRRKPLLLFYIPRFLRHIAVKKVTKLYNIYNELVGKSALKKR